jgi:tRNA pseudouridine65 synthase
MFEKLFENENCLIIDKPSGVSVHNPEDENVIDSYKKKGLIYYPVHRIDKETSGILILAKKKEVIDELSTSLKNSTKTYLAICKGTIDSKNGTWNFPITDKAEGRKSPNGIKSKRKIAKSEWRKVSQNKYFTKLEIQIETGRTHQIRKHTTLFKHSIVGDKRYGVKEYNDRIKRIYNFSRMALHSHKLEINISGELISILSIEPKEFSLLD